MYTLGCSAKIRERLEAPGRSTGRTTTRLGDWYAHTLGDSDVVLCVSLKTLLPVLTPLEPVASLASRVGAGAHDLFSALGVPPEEATAELAQMSEVQLGKTTKRWVNNAIKDFEWLLEARLEGARQASLELALWLAETPCALLGWKSPDEATRAAFGLSPARHRFELPGSRGASSAPVEPAPVRPAAPSWSPSLEIGVAEVDAQHQGLFAAFGALDDGPLDARGRGEAARMLDFLGRYVVEHFATEERAMLASAYPGYVAHKAEHDALVEELKALRAQWRREGPSTGLAALLSGRIRTWLSFHIGGTDRAMGRHLKSTGVPG